MKNNALGGFVKPESMNYRKKPVVIQAIKFDGTIKSVMAVREFTGQELNAPSLDGKEDGMYSLIIPTLEGDHTASPGDYIIRGIKGEYYPCKPDIFEASYDSEENKKAFNLNFGEAIIALQNGHKVARKGWNGKGMFLVIAGGYSVPKENLRPGTHITKEFLESRGVDAMEIVPHIDMWSADNKYVTGWLASQTDMLSSDWEIVP